MVSNPNERCAHCWHDLYIGMGDWARVCCNCGALWIPMDYGDPNLRQLKQHGPYVNPENPLGEHPQWTMLAPEQVKELFGLIPMTLEEKLALTRSEDVGVHTHSISSGAHHG